MELSIYRPAIWDMFVSFVDLAAAAPSDTLRIWVHGGGCIHAATANASMKASAAKAGTPHPAPR
jgi:hypothetical protein